MRKLLLTPLLLLALLAACEQSPPTSVQAPGDALDRSDARHARELYAAVMGRNLYVGTDVSKILAAPPEQIPIATWMAHVEVEQSLPAERMAAIADEIAAGRPDLVGLQEVIRLYTQTPGDFFQGNPQQADELQYDFLQLLLAALSARGMHYVVASVAVNMDLELPAFDPTMSVLYDARLVNQDVILAREGVTVRNTRTGIYQARVPINIAGMQIFYLRSWTAVDARVRGYEFRFVNTHLEAFSPLINWLQATELLGLFGGAQMPVVMVGDFNSPADAPAGDPRGDAYRAIVGAGFRDVWAAANPAQPGHTCCHDDDLRNPTPEFNRRIDFIFLSGQYRVPRGFRGVGSVQLVGADPAHRTPSGLWPSDHAGLLAQVWMP
ncbi:hypothetical protein BH23GEM7_BH23GEM7_36200 [soil metagenome]